MSILVEIAYRHRILGSLVLTRYIESRVQLGRQILSVTGKIDTLKFTARTCLLSNVNLSTRL